MFEHYFSAQWGNPLMERIAAKTKRNQETGCLEWTGSTDAHGYGQIKVPDGNGGWRGGRPTRIVWEVTYGPIPPGKSVCHHCDNRLCLEPAHLFVGSNAENMADRNAKERQARGERQWRATLTAPKVLTMRAAYAHGVHPVTLARAFDVSESAVSAVIHRHTWRHLP